MIVPSAAGAKRKRARLARALAKAENDLIKSARARGATAEQLEWLREMCADMRNGVSLRAAVAAPTSLQ